MESRIAAEDEMVAGTPAPEGAPALPPRISWGAVFAGGIVAVTVGVMLNVLGLAVGATTLDPAAQGDSPSASLLGLAGGLWLLVANLIGLGTGGWVAARLSGTADAMDAELHGLSVWALGFLLSALLLGNIAAGTANTAIRGASAVIGGTAQGIGQGAGAAVGTAVGEAARALAPQFAGTAETEGLVARLRETLETGGNPASMSAEQRRAEMARILGQRLRQGDFLPGQRDRLAQLVAAEYGLSPQEAEARIGRLETEARQLAAQAETEVRAAAQQAAEAAATGAYWIFAAMILGAAAAVLGARIGTRRVVRRRRVAAEALG